MQQRPNARLMAAVKGVLRADCVEIRSLSCVTAVDDQLLAEADSLLPRLEFDDLVRPLKDQVVDLLRRHIPAANIAAGVTRNKKRRVGTGYVESPNTPDNRQEIVAPLACVQRTGIGRALVPQHMGYGKTIRRGLPDLVQQMRVDVPSG